jgi:hypothetical protein
MHKKSPIVQCPHCWDFHPARLCNRRPCCVHCGGREPHQVCPIPERCTNCLGCHRADAPACPCRPVRQSGAIIKKTAKEKKRLREVGARSWAKAYPDISPTTGEVIKRTPLAADAATSPSSAPPALAPGAPTPVEDGNVPTQSETSPPEEGVAKAPAAAPASSTEEDIIMSDEPTPTAIPHGPKRKASDELRSSDGPASQRKLSAMWPRLSPPSPSL